jgi:hypothetical protein
MMVFTKNYQRPVPQLCIKETNMKKIESSVLLEQLQSDVRAIILQAEGLKAKSHDVLQWQPAPGKWSVAQVLEHLNIYSRYYLTAIEGKLHLNQSGTNTYFSPTWLGNYFTRLMQPADNGTVKKKMKAPKNALPARQPNATAMLEEYIHHQHQLLNLLQIAKTANLDYIKIPTSLSKFIRLKLGDTFRFFVAHEQRHFLQLQNVLSKIQL